jgi:hypothetical protein
MYIRVKGIILSASLLIGAIILIVGYGFLGDFAHTAYRQNELSLVALSLGIALASIWAIPQNLGGILAAFAILAITFLKLGFVPGLIATALCVVIFWLGLQDADYSFANYPKIRWWEWLAVILNVCLSIVMTIAFLQRTSLTGNIVGVALGILAGMFVVVGAQIKSAELAAKQALTLSTFMVLTGLVTGFAYGAFTYQPLRFL